MESPEWVRDAPAWVRRLEAETVQRTPGTFSDAGRRRQYDDCRTVNAGPVFPDVPPSCPAQMDQAADCDALKSLLLHKEASLAVDRRAIHLEHGPTESSQVESSAVSTER